MRGEPATATADPDKVRDLSDWRGHTNPFQVTRIHACQGSIIMIRLTFITAAAVASLAGATSAYAGDGDMFAGVGLGVTSFNYSSGSTSIGGSSTMIEGLLSGAYNITPTLGVQGDVILGSENLDIYSESADITELEGALHAFYRQPDSFLVGGFVQVGSADYGDDGPGDALKHVFGGAEGQVFLGDATLYGQVGGLRFSYDDSDYTTTGYFVTGEFRYYLEPNLKVEAHGGFNSLKDDDSGPELKTWSFGIGAEYRLEDSPFSLFATADHMVSTTDYDLSGLTMTSDRIMVGAKVNFGTDTMKERDRSGASLKPVQIQLPVLFPG